MKKLFIPALLFISVGVKAQQQPEKQITLKLSVSQAQLVLNSLADRKLSESFDTFLAIRLQIMSQLTDTTANKPKTDSVGNKKDPAKKEGKQ